MTLNGSILAIGAVKREEDHLNARRHLPIM
jgi:hypothetical protein